jgi:hypothetical protein
MPAFAERLQWFVQNKPEYTAVVARDELGDDRIARLLSVVSPERLRRILARALSPDEFLSDYGVRSLSRYHLDHPFEMRADGQVERVDYEPGESTSGLFGGNSNWRGPVWFPVNYLVIEALRRFDRYLGEQFRVEHPAGSGALRSLSQIADDLTERVISLFLVGPDGRRPGAGRYDKLQRDPWWRDRLLFFEYFHGDSGMGLGASHQTGWTGLVAEMICGLAERTGDRST